MAVLFIIYALGTYSVVGMASPVGYMLVALEPAMKHIIGSCILKCHTGNFGGVDHTGCHEVLVAVGTGIVTEVAVRSDTCWWHWSLR